MLRMTSEEILRENTEALVSPSSSLCQLADEIESQNISSEVKDLLLINLQKTFMESFSRALEITNQENIDLIDYKEWEVGADYFVLEPSDLIAKALEVRARSLEKDVNLESYIENNPKSYTKTIDELTTVDFVDANLKSKALDRLLELSFKNNPKEVYLEHLGHAKDKVFGLNEETGKIFNDVIVAIEKNVDLIEKIKSPTRRNTM